MAVIATLSTANPSSTGPWVECTLASAQACAATATTTATIVTPATAPPFLNANLPVGVTVLTPGTLTSAAGTAYNTVQNGANTGLPAGVGIAQVVLGSGTLTVAFVNMTGAAVTVTAGTRFLFVQNQGN